MLSASEPVKLVGRVSAESSLPQFHPDVDQHWSRPNDGSPYTDQIDQRVTTWRGGGCLQWIQSDCFQLIKAVFFFEQFQHVPSILQSLSIGTWLLWSFLFIESFWIDVSVKIYYLWLSSQTCDRYGQIMLTASDVSEYHAAWLQRGCVRPYAKSMPSGVPKMGVPRSSIWLYIYMCVYIYIIVYYGLLLYIYI